MTHDLQTLIYARMAFCEVINSVLFQFDDRKQYCVFYCHDDYHYSIDFTSTEIFKTRSEYLTVKKHVNTIVDSVVQCWKTLNTVQLYTDLLEKQVQLLKQINDYIRETYIDFTEAKIEFNSALTRKLHLSYPKKYDKDSQQNLYDDIVEKFQYQLKQLLIEID